MGRAAILIDGAYLSRALKDEFDEARIDFGKLPAELAPGRDVLRTYYYNCLPYKSDPPTPEESKRFGRAQSFMSSLERLPRFTVRLGKLAYRGRRSDGSPDFTQKRVDIMLAVDLVQLSTKRQIDTAVLLAGDSDFLPAVAVARDEGVLVCLYHFGRPHPAHRDLWDICDERTQITGRLIERIRR